MAFEFVTTRKPVSVNRKNSKRGKEPKSVFIEALRRDAQQAYQGMPLLQGSLYARIIWFHLDQPGDPDNIIKPILDALQTVVYDDDSLIAKIATERCNLRTEVLTLASRSARPMIFDALLDLIAEQHEPLLYIEVDSLATRELYFGPIR